jgi:hypothetical protein
MMNLLGKRLFTRTCVETAATVASAGEGWTTFFGARPANPARTPLLQLKRNLLFHALENTVEPELVKQLCGGANEALALAWETPEPLLVFPCLFAEITERIRARFEWHSRQRALSNLYPTSMLSAAAA